MATVELSLPEILGTKIPGYDPFATAAGDSWLDEVAAELAIGFFRDCLKHIEGAMAGQPFLLEDWQKAIIGNLFGWKRKDRKGRIVRRYREAMIYVPRKNGKTPLAAGICNYVLFCDGERGAQIYSAAAEREQAALLYRHAKGMVEQEAELLSRAKIYGGAGHRSIVLRDDEASVYKVLSADADTKHGGNSHLVIVDELHAQPNRDLVDVLQTSMASENRKQPLLVHITTADFDRESICNEKHDYACKVRDGVINDPSFLPVIYEALPDEDWTDPEVWQKANPNLGVSVSLDYLDRECMRAQETPTYENTFKRLHLNMKTQNDVLWIALAAWDLCAGLNDGESPIQWRDRMEKELAGSECFGGLDLATTTDIAALVLAFRRDGETILLPYFWVPVNGARQRSQRDRVPYETWISQGLIEATDGDVIDYDVIRAHINELQTQFNIKELAIDRWNATQICTQLAADSFEVFMHGQGYAGMSAPSKEFERVILEKTLRHGGNPVLRWMASNVAAEIDASGNIKPSKKKSTERIDGIVAGVMAVGRVMLQPDNSPQLIILK